MPKKLVFKDALGKVVKEISLVKEGRIHTSSPRMHLDQVSPKHDTFMLTWSTGLLKDVDFEEIDTIQIVRD
jgi:hypothetical protein